MKTFNQIRAPRAGTVTRILIESGSRSNTASR
jgi:biotin carboxyl carrier protein